MTPDIVLASASPRRRELLAQMGVPFRVEPTDADETLPEGAPPEEAASMLARRKAEEAAAKWPEALVIAADTLVLVGGRILGKPADGREAMEMLRLLRGREHTVATGVCVAFRGRYRCACELTKVRFDDMTEGDIENYVRTGEPMDKAGAYGIQGRAGIFIGGIEGCWYNVMGLPLSALRKLMEETLGADGFRALIDWKRVSGEQY